MTQLTCASCPFVMSVKICVDGVITLLVQSGPMRGCSKHGYCDEFSAPVGSISSTNSPAGAVQPTTAPAVGTCGFSDANRLLVAVGTEVPEIMNWCAGKLGP